MGAGCIGIYVNADKTKFLCFNQKRDISTLNGGSLKLVDKFTCLDSSISFTENDINIVPSEGVDSYWFTINHTEVRSMR